MHLTSLEVMARDLGMIPIRLTTYYRWGMEAPPQDASFSYGF
jgi:hypothetical protein